MKFKDKNKSALLACVKCGSFCLSIEVICYERKETNPVLFLSCQKCDIFNPFLGISITPRSGMDLIKRYKNYNEGGE